MSEFDPFKPVSWGEKSNDSSNAFQPVNLYPSQESKSSSNSWGYSSEPEKKSWAFDSSSGDSRIDRNSFWSNSGSGQNQSSSNWAWSNPSSESNGSNTGWGWSNSANAKDSNSWAYSSGSKDSSWGFSSSNNDSLKRGITSESTFWSTKALASDTLGFGADSYYQNLKTKEQSSVWSSCWETADTNWHFSNVSSRLETSSAISNHERSSSSFSYTPSEMGSSWAWTPSSNSSLSSWAWSVSGPATNWANKRGNDE